MMDNRAEMEFKIGIVGLGLIGGSMARAFSGAGVTVYGLDIDRSIQEFALMAGAITGELDESAMKSCDHIFLALPPAGAVKWLEDNAPRIPKDAIVTDCCGTKRNICKIGFRLAAEHGFTFVGGHPMAGTQDYGFRNSSKDMFRGTTFIIVPENRNDIWLLDDVKKLMELAGVGRVVSMSAEEHDENIAFTSQLSHIVSSAFVKSDAAGPECCAMTGGSFRDMTRIAGLDGEVWTDLCEDNRDNLIAELDRFMGELENYREALESGDAGMLSSLFADGSRRKAAIDDMMLGSA